MNYDHAQLADMAPVVNNLSGVTRYELQAAGVDPNMLVRLLIDGIERGKAYAIYQDDIPIAIFWFYPSLFEAETSFIATQAFFDRPMASIRTSQEVLGCILEDYPNMSLVAYTVSQHPRLDKWFRLLGFVELPHNGPAKRFEFIPNWC